jgi:hypothetical protein
MLWPPAYLQTTLFPSVYDLSNIFAATLLVWGRLFKPKPEVVNTPLNM